MHMTSFVKINNENERFNLAFYITIVKSSSLSSSRRHYNIQSLFTKISCSLKSCMIACQGRPFPSSHTLCCCIIEYFLFICWASNRNQVLNDNCLSLSWFPSDIFMLSSRRWTYLPFIRNPNQVCNHCQISSFWTTWRANFQQNVRLKS